MQLCENILMVSYVFGAGLTKMEFYQSLPPKLCIAGLFKIYIITRH